MTPSTSIRAGSARQSSADLSPNLKSANLNESNETALETLVQHVLSSGKITAAERLGFHQFLLADLPLTSAMTEQIRQVFDRVRAGLIRVVD